MNKIPTAGEFLEMHPQISHYYDDKLKLMVVPAEQVYQAMIEFAKLHVEAAIKTCIEEAPSGSSTDTVSYEDVEEALKNCYPLKKIK